MKRLAPILVGLALLALFLPREGRQARVGAPVESKTGASPEDCVRDMFTAAGEGRAREYLDFFCDPLQAALLDTARSMGEQKFREYIQNAAAPIKGMAFSEISRGDGGEASLRCELVFMDRNEVQRFTLRKVAGRWRIAGMTPAKRIQPPVPYGQKVYE